MQGLVDQKENGVQNDSLGITVQLAGTVTVVFSVTNFVGRNHSLQIVKHP